MGDFPFLATGHDNGNQAAMVIRDSERRKASFFHVEFNFRCAVVYLKTECLNFYKGKTFQI